MSSLIKKSISKDKYESIDSKRIQVDENKTYKISVNVAGFKGLPYSSYFVAINLDGSYREIGRFIRWISNFESKPTIYELSFTTKPTTKYVVLGYRINFETPVKSDIELGLEDLNSLKIQETNDNIPKFDDITKYQVPQFLPLKENEEEILEKRMVWLCASPRSGTTWLGTRLLKHPSNIIWHEPWIGLHLASLRATLNPATDFKKEGMKFERIIDFEASNGEYFFSPHHKQNWLPALRKLIISRTFSHAQTLTKNIIIKDPVGSNATDLLSQCLPNSKIIFLLRDGRDEVDSRIAMHRKESWAQMKPLQTAHDRDKAVKYYSSLWVTNINNIKKGFDAHNNNLKILIKYEDLLTNTFEELKKIYDFIGIKINSDELKKVVEIYDFKNIKDSEKGEGKFNRSAKIGGWKENFTDKEQNIMNEIMGDTLKKMGY